MIPDDVPDPVRTRLLVLPGDLDAAVRVWQLANLARGKVPDENRRARVRTKLTEPDALAVVAADAGGIVGMALAEPGRDDDGLGASLPHLCHISMVFVHPEHWGRRVGQRLLDAVAGHAAQRGQFVLQLWTGQDNHRAQRLYRRAGFRPTGRTKQLPTGQLVIQLARVTGAALF
jgi:ribosomal protein S18 acetylase RimI-like enzyme